MKKLITILCIAFAGTTVTAQKADIKSKDIPLTFELPSYVKNLKTFSYDIQDDGKYWNYTPSPEYYPKDEYPNLASLTDGITVDGLEQVSENADLRIMVGFLGNQLSVNNGLIYMKGTFSIMIFVEGNKLVHNYITDVKLNQVVNPEKFPISTRDERNQTKARMLTIHTQDYLDKLSYLFKETTLQKLPFGLFKKTKGGNAEAFNTASQPFIDAILANPTDAATLDKAIAYWKSQIEVDFGKKVKDKVKNKVIYVNLTTASILKDDTESTNSYYEIAKQNSGFFDLCTVDYTNLFKKRDDLEAIKKQELIAVTTLPNTVYFITLDGGGTYTYKGKEIIFSKIEIDRFIPKKDSGIASLDTTEKSRIFIYEDDVKTLRHFASEHNKIITNDGKEIIFQKEKGTFKPYIKQADGTFTLYESL